MRALHKSRAYKLQPTQLQAKVDENFNSEVIGKYISPRSPSDNNEDDPYEARRSLMHRYSNLIGGNADNLASTALLKNKIKRSSLDDKNKKTKKKDHVI